MHKWSMFTLFIIASSLAIYYAAASMDFSGTKAETKAEVTIVEKDSEGAQIYAKATCVSCHGADLKGMASAGIPELLGVGDKHDKAGIADIIKNGIGAMSSQYDQNIDKGLTPEELDKLAEWLSIQKAPVAEEAAAAEH